MLRMGFGWGPRRWVTAASAVVIVGGTWWLLAAGSNGVNVATVLALTVAVVPLVWAVLDKLPTGTPQNEALTSAAARLARAVTQASASERNRLFGDGEAAPADVSFSRYQAAGGIDAHLVRWREDGGDAEGTLAGLAEFYQNLGRGRLAVLGDPGSGKSVMMNRLALEFAESAEQLGVRPVPLRLSLPAFNPGEDANRANPGELADRLTAWIVENLKEVYTLRPRLATALVDGGWILPMLDGLDEMDREGVDPARARAVVRALNHPGPEGLPRVVLACREQRYLQLARERPGPGRISVLQDTTAIYVQPLEPAQVRAYLTERFPHPEGPGPASAVRLEERWQLVIDYLCERPDSALARALGSPLTLYLAVTGYYDPGSEPARLLRLNADGIQRDLLDRLIPALTVCNPRPEGGLYNPDDVTKWLETLSLHLREQQANNGSGTDLYLHRLWRVAGGRAPRYQSAFGASLAIAIPLLGVVAWMSDQLALTLQSSIATAGVVLVSVILGFGTQMAHEDPVPQRIDVRALRSLRSVRAIASALGYALMFLLSLTLVAGLALALTGHLVADDLAGSRGQAVETVLAGAFVYIFIAALMMRITQLLGQEQMSVDRPHQLIRQSLLYSLTIAILFTLGTTAGFALGIGFLRRELGFGPTFALTFGLAVGSSFGIFIGCSSSPWPRYAAAVRISARRGLLPRRLACFLDWACEAGLVKISGIAIQFRHQNLQTYLVASATSGSAEQLSTSAPPPIRARLHPSRALRRTRRLSASSIEQCEK